MNNFVIQIARKNESILEKNARGNIVKRQLYISKAEERCRRKISRETVSRFG